MSIKEGLKKRLKNFQDKRFISGHRKVELNKSIEAERVKLYENIILTEKQIREIDNLFLLNYGEKIPYNWHRIYTSYTGHFDAYYFPEYLYISEFEHFMIPDKQYADVMENKNIISILARGVGVETPGIVCSCAAGMLRDSNYNLITMDVALELILDAGAVFIKPTVDSGSGKGCKLYSSIDPTIIEEIKNYLFLLKGEYVVQNVIRCHDSIRKIYSESVNTFRVITYRWIKEGKPFVTHMPVIMRIGCGRNYLDNAHAGGMFIGVEDNGELHKIAFTEFGKKYNMHPDTDLVFEGYCIENFDKVIVAAEKMACALPQVGVVNWDFTINSEGLPVLVEANCVDGSIWLIEIAHGVGGFKENTESVLKWIALQKKLNIDERKQYPYGLMTVEKED